MHLHSYFFTMSYILPLNCIQDGQTALYYASCVGNLEVVQLLLHEKADAGIRTEVCTCPTITQAMVGEWWYIMGGTQYNCIGMAWVALT